MGIWEEIENLGPVDKKFDILELAKRDFFISVYSWAVPSKEAVRKIREFVGKDSVLEIGAGKGLWAKLLREENLQVTAVDDMSWKRNERFNPSVGQFSEVLRMNARQAVKAFRHEVLMLIWPPYQESMASTALEGFSGKKLVLVGESEGGCNADDKFYEDLNDQWLQQDCIDIPQWPGIHDFLSLWSRKSEEEVVKMRTARRSLRTAKRAISKLASQVEVEVFSKWGQNHLSVEELHKLRGLPAIQKHWERYRQASKTLGVPGVGNLK